jgi:uncharacterized phage-associated protein
MPVSAHDVAAALRERLPGLGAKKLHKLLYYCQGHHLAAFGEPLFDEPISAWDMGPVVGTLWKAEKDDDAPPPARTALGEAVLNTIGYVVSRYGGLTGRDLEHLTHNEDPWLTANRYRRPGGGVRIENAWIEEYFRANTDPAAGEDEEPLDSDVLTKWLREAASRPPYPGRPDSLEELRARRGQGA